MGWPAASLSTRSVCGLPSKRGIGGIDPLGGASGARMPGSRKGRGTPVTTPWNTPVAVAVAEGSSIVPSPGAVTVSEGTRTRIPSTRSNWSNGPAGSGNVALSGTRVGNGCGAPTDDDRGRSGDPRLGRLQRVGGGDELGDGAGHAALASDGRTGRCGCEDEYALGRGRVGIHLCVRGLQEEPVAGHRRDDPRDGHRRTDDRRRRTGALHVVDRGRGLRGGRRRQQQRGEHAE